MQWVIREVASVRVLRVHSRDEQGKALMKLGLRKVSKLEQYYIGLARPRCLFGVNGEQADNALATGNVEKGSEKR